MELKAKRSETKKDRWSVQNGNLLRSFEVEHTNGFVHAISWAEDQEVTLSNFDLRAIVAILKEGNYRLVKEG